MEPQDLTRPPDDAAPDGETGDVPVEEELTAAPMKERAPRPPTIGQLRRERRKLWDERQDTVYHVGGLAVDLHRRGMIDDEESLIVRRAEIVDALDERILAIDEQLSTIDANRRRHRERMPKPSGYCMSCGAPFLPDAAFCSRCGSRVYVPPVDDEPVAAEDPAPDMPTQVIDPIPDEERGHTELLEFDDQWTQAIRHHFEDRPR